MNQWIRTQWYVGQVTVFCVMALLAIGLNYLLNEPALEVQLVALALPVAILGIPHGALDYALGRRITRPRLGPYWPMVFLPLYLLIASLVVVLWGLMPAFSLAVFLLISWIHFGVSDTGCQEQLPALRWLEMLARGSVVISFPAAFHHHDVALLFGYLTPAEPAARLAAGCAWLAPFAIAALLTAMIRHIKVALAQQHKAHWCTVLELTMLALLFALAPPLLAFGVYFCALHSLRQLLLSTDQQAGVQSVLSGLIRQTAPVTAATLCIAIIAYMLMDSIELPEKLTQVLFIGLAALTVPHMMLTAVDARLSSSLHTKATQ
ncbi:MAG: beta-carotene 15,15'-dioxygenase, Brp/Blh family [Candidatus Competibacteraceae bacterium]|nr:beta-carotene 15,15'-dioxygenase, Brp/Blh family [Candidatus Competibacteraceae bacterium]